VIEIKNHNLKRAIVALEETVPQPPETED
jgi:hypothetical protein